MVVVEQAAEDAAGVDEGALAVGTAVVGGVDMAEGGHEQVVDRDVGVGVAQEGAEVVVGRAERADVAGRAGRDEAVDARRVRREGLAHAARGVAVGDDLGAERRAEQLQHLRQLAPQLVLAPAERHGPAVRLEAPDLDVADEAVEDRPAGVPHAHPAPEGRRLGLPVHLGQESARARLDDFGAVSLEHLLNNQIAPTVSARNKHSCKQH